jgi:SAM-dependent methyltransferase
MLTDRTNQAGDLSVYFFQDLWAARLILARSPSRHLDIGSRIDGFVAYVLLFLPVTVIDIRPLQVEIPNLSFIQGDGMDLRMLPDNSVESLSCLHALEHFGLGRYGDRVNPLAHEEAMLEFQRVLAPQGHLYLSVPIGRERLRFNSQRVFAPQTILEAFQDLTLSSFSAVDDAGNFVHDTLPERFRSAVNSCGLFDFVKV